MKIKLTGNDALIVVDVQRDFCPGGALAVPEGDRIVPVLNRYIERFREGKLLIVATRDWHPKNHKSFKEFGGIWPVHCVQRTDGAEFHPELNLPEGVKIISKATKVKEEAYSGFQGTKLKEHLKMKRVKRIFVGGLATDYCVKNTVLDGLKTGFTTFLLLDAIKGVDVKPGDSEKAIDEMLGAGAVGIEVADIR
jgi:nicotinamidase/pyrazinamidase